MRTSSCSWIVAILLACLIAPAARAEDAPTAKAEAGVAFEPGTPSLPDILKKAGTEKKPAFLDFFTDT